MQNNKIESDGYKDAKELKEMYLKLKEMAARLVELEESHTHAKHFRKVVDNAILEIDQVAHLLDREVGKVLFMERRKNPRIHKNLPIKIQYEDLNIMTETRDISCSGTYCSTSQELPLMARVKVFLMLPFFWMDKRIAKNIKCEGIVVRSEKIASNKCNIGIVFTDITRGNKSKICEYVEHALQGR